MTININQLNVGKGLLIDNQIYIVTDLNYGKHTKGGAFCRVKLKSLVAGSVLDRTFKAADKLEDVFLEERSLQFMYRSGDTFHFMDHETYEETMVHEDLLGEGVQFLQDNLEVTAVLHDHRIMKINMPNFIVTEITQTEPGFKGDSARAGTKPATIDTGAIVQVPLFINTGDWIRVDTRTCQYVERVQK